MRKWSGCGVALALAAVVSAGGSQAQAISGAEEARAKKIISGSCVLCHGAEGESSSEIFPRLAGQHWQYIAKQLQNFKSGQRSSTAMASMVGALSADDMVALGKYFESRTAQRVAPKDADLAGMGAYVYKHGNRFSGVPACASCHGGDAKGTEALPRLAGQAAAYTEKQLKEFHQRQRNNDNAVMHAVVEKMTALEMAAVAEYLSGL